MPRTTNTEIPAIHVQQVSKTYRGETEPAIQNISLKILPGQRIGLIGANGSGKTTLLRLIMNFIVPDRGEITIFGEKNLEKARRYLGFVSEHQQGLENFTPRELFYIAGQTQGLSGAQIKRRLEELLRFSGLENVADHLLEGFSKGMAQRLFVCLALIHQPHILLLDEPMSGLDHGGQRNLRELLLKLPQQTLVYASHNLEEIETLCTRVILLHQGQIVTQLDMQEYQQEIFLLDLSADVVPLLEQFSTMKPQILSKTSNRVQLQLQGSANQMQQFLEACKLRGITIERLRSHTILEELYARYVET